MENTHSFFRSHIQVLTILLILLAETGCGRFTDIEKVSVIENKQDQTESTVNTQIFNVEFIEWKYAAQNLSDAEIQANAGYSNAFDGNTGTTLPGTSSVATLPVENFYTLLKLCVLSRECAGD